MKERADMTSDSGQQRPLLPAFPLAGPPAQSRSLSQKGGGLDGPWRDLPSRGADINLLANSLTTRLRKAARQRGVKSGGTPVTTAQDSRAARSAPVADSQDSRERKAGKREATPQARPSILKRTLSKDEAERLRRHLQDCRSPSPPDPHHLPDVFMDRRLSSSTGQLDRLDPEVDNFNNQLLDRASPAIAFVGGSLGGGGGGGGGSTRRYAANGQVVWVKRAGIFQPADKYAPGRQSLHGDSTPFSRSVAVDYETVTLPSRPDSSQSDSLSLGWSSGKGSRKKGLKVSWKHPEDPPQDSRLGDTASSLRQRSAGTTQSDTAASKPRFKPGKTRVPVVGVRWKVPTPAMGKGPGGGPGGEGAGPPSSRTSSGYCSPSSSPSTPSSASSGLPHSTPAKPTAHTRDTRHPWRALMSRDVHPVTTAMEREGTSVSKTKWHVPGLRRVPQYTFIEDLMDSRCQQWLPAAPPPRHTTRATLDAQSLQARLKDGGPPSPATTATSTTVSNSVSNGTDCELESVKRS